MRKTGLAATHRTQVRCEMVFDYEKRDARSPSPAELIVLLHGFEESGRRILSKLEPVLPPDALVIAPNGLFPIPRRIDSKPPSYKLGHSWYIYNPAVGEYVVDMTPGLSYLHAGLGALGLLGLPKRLIGFSQGGYFAPIAAARLGGVRQVIGLACEFLVDEIPNDSSAPASSATGLGFAAGLRIDGVCGALDEIVSPAEARASHARLSERGLAGELIVLERTGHAIDDEMRGAVAKLLSLC